MSDSNFSFSLAAAPIRQEPIKGKLDQIKQHINDFSIVQKKKEALTFLFANMAELKVKSFFKENKIEISEMIQDGRFKTSENSLKQFELITGQKIEAVKISQAQKIENTVEATLVTDFDKIHGSLSREGKTALRRAMKTDVPGAVELLLQNGMREEDAKKIIKFLKSNEGRIHVRDLRQAERVKVALENLKSDGLITDDLYKSVNSDIDKQIQIFKNESNSLKINQVGDETNSVSEGQDAKALVTEHTTNYLKVAMNENKSYQIIVDLLKAAKMTMEEFLKSVEKSKDFSKSLEKLVDKAYESYKEESVRALDKKAIPSSELLKVTQLIEGLKKDIVSVQNIIKKAISLAQIKEKNPLIIKFNNFVNVISEFEKTLNQISNNGNSEPEKAISMARNGTFATLVFSLTSQGKKDLKLNIDNIEKNVDEMIKKVEGFLANNDLSNLDIKNEGIVMKDLNNLGKLIDGIKSMMLTATTSKEFSVMENNLSMALGLQDKISESLGNKEGAIA